MADIIIKGMGMPKTCNECPLNVSIYTYDGGDETCALNAWDGYSEQPKTTRHPDCPLVPLPEGHGKMVDLDAIIKMLNEMEADFNKKKFYQGALWFHAIAELLKKAPAIVPAEPPEEVDDGN